MKPSEQLDDETSLEDLTVTQQLLAGIGAELGLVRQELARLRQCLASDEAPETVYGCTHCDKVFPSNERATAHVVDDHGAPRSAAADAVTMITRSEAGA